MTQDVLHFPEVKKTCSAEEWKVRVNLAAAYRLMDLFGMSDMIANHISARVPGRHDAFFINPYGLLYEEITASSLVTIDQNGEILAKPDFGDLDYGVNRAGFVIHSAIHRARPELECVIHSHTWAGMAVSALKCGLLPMSQTAMRFARIGYHDFQGVALDLAEQESLVADLGTDNALILRNHGLLTVGNTIAEAFNAMHRLELSCKTQLAAMGCDEELIEPPEDVVEKTFMNYQPNVRRPFGVLEWPALLRKLDRRDPSSKL
jgi:ribulose-5-phosphate 4-epimerase/fuculose-1-phosphate aldolase